VREESLALALACLASLVARRPERLVHNQSHFASRPLPVCHHLGPTGWLLAALVRLLHTADPCALRNERRQPCARELPVSSIPEVYTSRLEERAFSQSLNTPQEPVKMIQLKV
jgi:hypothetical protein